MRQFSQVRQGRRPWKKGQVSLLGNESPPSSPSPLVDAYSMQMLGHADAHPNQPNQQQQHHQQKRRQQQDPEPVRNLFPQLDPIDNFSSFHDGASATPDWPTTPQKHVHPSSIQPRSRYTHSSGASSSVGTGLQFVPAYEEPPAGMSTPSTLASTPSPSQKTSSLRSSFQGRNATKSASPHEVYGSGSEVGTSNSRGRASRIGRLASLFSSRAVVSNKFNATSNAGSADATRTPNQPTRKKGASSPSRSSEASSGNYVGWPGTQDKQGDTVKAKSNSFGESDIGIPHRQRVHYENEMTAAADNEVALWMNNEVSFEDCSDKDSHPSPSRRLDRPETTERVANRSSPSSSDAGNAADFHLAAVVADAAISAMSPVVKQQPQQQRQQQHHTEKAEHPASEENQPPEAFDDDGLQYRINYDIYGDVRSTQELRHDNNQVSGPLVDPWGTIENLSDASPNTTFSKTSSAYFTAKDAYGKNVATYGIADRNRHGAASVMRGLQETGGGNANANANANANSKSRPHVRTRVRPQQTAGSHPQPPTEEALAMNDHLHPAHKTYNAVNAIGFRGLLNKTQDVPNLMDDADSVSTASRATSIQSFSASQAGGTKPRTGTTNRYTPYEQPETIEEQASSDVFDGVKSTVSLNHFKEGDGATKNTQNILTDPSINNANKGKADVATGPKSTLGIQSEPSGNYRSTMNIDPSLNVVLLGGGLTTIQTTANDFSQRITASDYDENLTNSDYDQYGFAEVPAFHTMMNSTKNLNASSSSSSPSRLGATSLRLTEDSLRTEYSGSDSGSSLFSNPYGRDYGWRPAFNDLSRYYIQPDEMKKVVRQFRKISKDRCAKMGLEDRIVEEDAVKAFALAEMRSRIMEKDIERGLERRGWTGVVDDIVDTSRGRAALRVRDAVIVAKAWRDGVNPADVVRSSLLTRQEPLAFYIWRPPRRPSAGYWEEVRWHDDNEICLQQCASHGSRCLRGFELFTIGDCQSMLLKLTNDHCAVSENCSSSSNSMPS